MKLAEMSPAAQAERRLFLATLASAGWEVESWDAVLEDGGDTDPQAEASYSGPEIDLGIQFHAAGPHLSFQLDGKESDFFLDLRIFPAAGLAAVLARIVDAQDRLTTENAADLVKALIALCDPLLIVTDDGLQRLSL